MQPADTSSGVAAVDDKPVTDISHLVHRKRVKKEVKLLFYFWLLVGEAES